jgi:sialate O-acetylesterase
MPFYIVQLARMVGGDESKPEEVNAVRAAHLAVGSSTNNSATVAALDLGMSSGSHLDTDGYKRVGKRLARVALADVYEVESIRFGPKLIGVKVEGTTTHPMLRVQFEDVNGRLSPDARVAGFTIRGQDGSKIVVNHLNAAVNPDSPDEVLITCDMSIPPDASLWYGYGWNPYCNLTDEADMAAPAFGPVRLEAK